MTVDEISAEMQAVTKDAGEGGLTDDQVKRYEELEGQLTRARKSDEILKRQAAYDSVATKVVQTATNTQEDDTLERAFAHYMRTGKENADLQELRAQSESVGSQGGFLVPDGFRNKIVDRMKDFGGLANVVDEYTTGDGRSVPWGTIDDVNNVGEIVEEGGSFTSGADMVFGTNNLGAYSYMAGGAGSTPLRVSYELAQDAAFDIEGLVSNKLGERIARIQAVHLISGTGVKQPLGILTGRTGVQTAANNALTYADLLNMVHTVDPAYRKNGRWAFNDLSLKAIRGLMDTTGRPLLKSQNDGIAGGPEGETLLGYPVTIDQGFATFTNNSPTVNWGVFGDLREGYVVRRVRDVQVLVNPYSRMSNREIEYSAWARMDATQQNTAAYTALTGKA